MSTSKVPAVIDYLVTLFTNAQATTLNGVTVFDGPAVTADPAPLALWVGVDDPDATAATVAASSTQEWAGLGHQSRNELLSVRCVAQAWSGADDVRTVRQSVYAIIAAVEDLVRNDAALGGNLLFTSPGVTNGELRQLTSGAGAAARVTFTIDGKARIGS